MKKIYLIIIIFIIPIKCYAQTFYTNYELWESNSLNDYEESDVIKKETFKTYHNYILSNVYQYYADSKKNINDKVDINNNYIVTNHYKNYSSIYLGPYTTQRIQKYDSLQYFMFRSIIANNTVIKSIEFLYKGNSINYNIINSNYEINNYLLQNTEFTIDLLSKYQLKDLKIIIKFNSPVINRIAFMIKAYNDSSTFTHFTCELIRGKADDIYIIEFLEKEEFTNLLNSILWINKNEINYIKEVNYYQKSLIYYRFYYDKKLYLPIYSKEPENNNMIDYSDYKMQTDYYKRERFDVLDNIYSSEDLAQIIYNSTIPITDIKVENNLENITNGEYIFEFTYKNNIFYKKIKIEMPINKELVYLDSNKEQEKKANIVKAKKPKTVEDSNISEEYIKEVKIEKSDIKETNGKLIIATIIILILIVIIYFNLKKIMILLSKLFKKN